MKKLLQIAFLGVLGTGFYQSSQAQNKYTYYVCAGTTFEFTTTPADQYDWRDLSNPSSPVSTAATLSATAPSLVAGDDAESMMYVFSAEIGGCWTEVDTFEVWVLPPLDVEITGIDSVYCVNSGPHTVTMSADFKTPPGDLPAGVEPNKFQWTVDNVLGGTGQTETYTTTSAAGAIDVEVVVGYTLPANDGEKMGGCDGASTATNTINVTPTPTTPTVTFQ